MLILQGDIVVHRSRVQAWTPRGMLIKCSQVFSDCVLQRSHYGRLRWSFHVQSTCSVSAVITALTRVPSRSQLDFYHGEWMTA